MQRKRYDAKVGAKSAARTAAHPHGWGARREQLGAPVTGRTGSVTGRVGSITGRLPAVAGSGDSFTGSASGVTGRTGSVTGRVGSVTGRVGSTTMRPKRVSPLRIAVATADA
jgi:hypothetical protein